MEKYLLKKAIKTPWELNPLPEKKNYKFIIVIPSFNEKDLILTTLDSIKNQKSIELSKILVIVVINNSEMNSPIIKENNKITNNELNNFYVPFEISIIDAYEQNPLPQKHAGVGLARKIGFDLSLPFANSNTVLIALDADTIISSTYFSQLNHYFSRGTYHCIIPGIKHQKGETILQENAIREYENFLFITAKEMKHAGSPYGFITMGSAMAFTKNCYMKAGGIPRKKATEDFYFLQEVVKTSSVFTIPKVLVYPSARPSDRVYLGTGFRMMQAKNGENLTDLYYNKKAFQILKNWLILGQKGFNSPLEKMLIDAIKIHPNLPQFLKENRIIKIWDGLNSSCKNEEKFKHQFHCWFDGLKTHRLLKYFSIDPYPSSQ
jgi:glycosyltransferase involved in cell wall biosynthesis